MPIFEVNRPSYRAAVSVAKKERLESLSKNEELHKYILILIIWNCSIHRKFFPLAGPIMELDWSVSRSAEKNSLVVVRRTQEFIALLLARGHAVILAAKSGTWETPLSRLYVRWRKRVPPVGDDLLG